MSPTLCQASVPSSVKGGYLSTLTSLKDRLGTLTVAMIYFCTKNFLENDSLLAFYHCTYWLGFKISPWGRGWGNLGTVLITDYQRSNSAFTSMTAKHGNGRDHLPTPKWNKQPNLCRLVSPCLAMNKIKEQSESKELAACIQTTYSPYSNLELTIKCASKLLSSTQSLFKVQQTLKSLQSTENLV